MLQYATWFFLTLQCFFGGTKHSLNRTGRGKHTPQRLPNRTGDKWRVVERPVADCPLRWTFTTAALSAASPRTYCPCPWREEGTSDWYVIDVVKSSLQVFFSPSESCLVRDGSGKIYFFIFNLLIGLDFFFKVWIKSSRSNPDHTLKGRVDLSSYDKTWHARRSHVVAEGQIKGRGRYQVNS